MPTSEAPLLSNFIAKSSASQHTWLKYALASFFFGAVGQFSMGFLSEDITSRYIISLGDLIFVIFCCFLKYFYFRFKNERWANIKDCSWIDPETGSMKQGTFKYLLLSIATRFFYGYTIIIAYAEANSEKMNIGIILSVRSCEALFAALWTYLLLKEKLSCSKLVGLFILTGGVVGLSLPSHSENVGFSLTGIIWALVAALISSLRNFTIKRLAESKVDGVTIVIHSVFWADLITVLIGIISMIWGMGFNHEFFDKYLQQESIEFTWRRFGLSVFIGFVIFFTLTTTANATQHGYTGIILFILYILRSYLYIFIFIRPGCRY